MIRQLQRKFIRIAMLSFAVVLLAVMGIVNLLNYQNILHESDQLLDLISRNSGVFPEIFNWSEEEKPPIPDGIDWERLPDRFRSPEAPFENRYFSVLLSSEDEVLLTNTKQIMAVDEAGAVRYAEAAIASGKRIGGKDQFRFTVIGLEDGNTLVVFLDCGRALGSWQAFLKISVMLYFCALAAVLLMLVFASRRAVQPIASSYEKQKQFVADAGHEIKTPLTIIDADTDVLAMEYPDSEWVKDIKTQTRRLSSLTTDLIELSRMEEPRRMQGMIDTPLSDLVTETVQTFAGMAKAQGLGLSVIIQPLLTVQGDEKALGQLVSVLMDNALKYASPEGTVSVSLTRSGRNALLRVTNPCAPISQEQLSHLFDRFYRTDNARTIGKGGYGIGLSIAKAIVQAHKGKISAQSKDGKSLILSVSLPLSKVEPIDAP